MFLFVCLFIFNEKSQLEKVMCSWTPQVDMSICLDRSVFG